MVSDDTKEKTIKFLKENNNFGLDKGKNKLNNAINIKIN